MYKYNNIVLCSICGMREKDEGFSYCMFSDQCRRGRGDQFRLLRCTPSLFLYFSIGKYSASRRDMIWTAGIWSRLAWKQTFTLPIDHQENIFSLSTNRIKTNILTWFLNDCRLDQGKQIMVWPYSNCPSELCVLTHNRWEGRQREENPIPPARNRAGWARFHTNCTVH